MEQLLHLSQRNTTTSKAHILNPDTNRKITFIVPTFSHQRCKTHGFNRGNILMGETCSTRDSCENYVQNLTEEREEISIYRRRTGGNNGTDPIQHGNVNSGSITRGEFQIS